MRKAFPSRLFVVVRDDDDDDTGSYFYAEENTELFEDGDRVAIYELRDTKAMKVKTTRELE